MAIGDITRTEPEIFDVWAFNISRKDAGIFIHSGLSTCRTRSVGLVTASWNNRYYCAHWPPLICVPGQLIVDNIPIRGKGEKPMAKRYPSAKSPFAVIDLGSSRFACLIEIRQKASQLLLGQAIHLP